MADIVMILVIGVLAASHFHSLMAMASASERAKLQAKEIADEAWFVKGVIVRGEEVTIQLISVHPRRETRIVHFAGKHPNAPSLSQAPELEKVAFTYRALPREGVNPNIPCAYLVRKD